ncbi:class I SAM-dependent DNA methyltransferase [Anaerocolumna chitinilytica]|uniref:Methyltransferase type 12 n=1 Tax=Anaerocolumna chitinilytica TaxID=1727145 RepID=A0A7I8DL03_9FIRM|nr:class I SAM-dependent methyltransferase [Anaerocolumna chitinilytica]BCJ99040.1 methyltransferase type 12 [Anaerocolumna chitinilytica]
MGNTEIFDAMANEYDTTERIQIAKLASDAIRESLINGKEKQAIDFGCGTGLVGMNLLNEFKRILFLDSSQSMIDQIKKKITEYDIVKADTVCFDLEKEKSSPFHADYIFMVQVLLHIKETDFVLSRLFEMLNPGGHLLIVDFNKNEDIISDLVHNGFDQNELTVLLKNIGFQKIQSKTFYSGSKIFMNKDASMFILDAMK